MRVDEQIRATEGKQEEEATKRAGLCQEMQLSRLGGSSGVNNERTGLRERVLLQFL